MVSTKILIFAVYLFCFFHQNSSQGDTAGRNLALGKPVWQYPGIYNGHSAEKAVDGDTEPDYGHGSCSHTFEQSEEPAFWTVDLSDLYYVTSVIIYNRNQVRERLRQFKIYGDPGNTRLYDDATQIVPQHNNAIILTKIDSTKPFRNITIYLPTVEGQMTILTLCEVKIYGGCFVPAIPNGRFSGEKADNYVVTYRSKIQASCSTGYKLGTCNEVNTLTCGYNYTWDNPVPTCTLITCEPLTLCNGLYKYRKGDIAEPFAYGSIATGKCNKGFELKGSTESTCSEHGNWTGSTARCVVTECGLPDSTSRTSYYLLNDDNGTKARYRTVMRWTCLGEGYVLQSGSEYQVCTENGTWSGNLPVCAVNDSKIQGSLIGSITLNAILFMIVLVLLLCLFILKRKYDVLIKKSDKYSNLTTRPSAANQDTNYTNISSMQHHGQTERTVQYYENQVSTGE